jgi:hypothetical protein
MEDQPKPSTVILNVCPHPALREAREQILRNAGYVPASAGTAEEAASLAASVTCAIIFYSFEPDQRRLIQSQLEKILPAAKIIQLSSGPKNDPLALLSSLRDALWLLAQPVRENLHELQERHTQKTAAPAHVAHVKTGG